MHIRLQDPRPYCYPDTPGSACLPPTHRVFFLGVFADGKKNKRMGSACIDASRLMLAVSFQIRLVAKKQACLTRLFFCIPAVKPSEFTERTLIEEQQLLVNLIIVYESQ